uniref:Chloride channel protein n=1 Tax=Amphora coffeiformis TaxID=265554 RepID=A0A7S3KZV1_9STRA|mmetsp:Transcript_539/g.1250  ORF Transcript_539/g.1250 Transcript_539/m.1250 type:complete len:651 (+) Transcript_539:641-2593(+)
MHTGTKIVMRFSSSVALLAWLPTSAVVGAFQSSSLFRTAPSQRTAPLTQLPSSSAAEYWYKGSTKNNPVLLEQLTGRIIDGAPLSSARSGVDGDAVASSATTDSNKSEDPAELKFRYAAHDLSLAAIVGLVSGILIAIFKFSIEFVRRAFYEQSIWEWNPATAAVIPALGGLVVGLLILVGNFSPGLRQTVEDVDQAAGTLKETPKMGVTEILKRQLGSLRKTIAAVFTLGSGCSLGPEGPCVEIGMSVARVCMDATTPDSFVRDARARQGWNRRLLACGAASGVAAGFNAPVAGVFFALEVMGNAFSAVTNDKVAKNALEGNVDEMAPQQELSATERISPILVSSVCAALAAKSLLGEHFVLKLSAYSLKNPLMELPLYMLLGVVSGGVAFTFAELARLSQGFFKGDEGSKGVQKFMKNVPKWAKPVVGGLICGLVGLFFPQILFFGYETLNSLLAKTATPTALILSLLAVKIFTTAVSAGSGLIGGTFAPALFLGAMTGAAFHNIWSALLDTVLFQSYPGLPGMADLPAYAMIGSASVLAALFRAPLTASMVLFELSRDYDVILPLMVSAGLGSLVSDILDNKFEQTKRRRDKDTVSWGDLASQDEAEIETTMLANGEELLSMRSKTPPNGEEPNGKDSTKAEGSVSK